MQQGDPNVCQRSLCFIVAGHARAASIETIESGKLKIGLHVLPSILPPPPLSLAVPSVSSPPGGPPRVPLSPSSRAKGKALFVISWIPRARSVTAISTASKKGGLRNEAKRIHGSVVWFAGQDESAERVCPVPAVG